MSTIRLQCLEDALVKLNTSRPGNVPEAKWDDGFLIQLAPGETAMRIRPVKERVVQVQGPEGPLVERTTVFSVDCYAAGGPGLSPVQAVDPLQAWATKALGGQRLAGKSQETDEDEATWQWERSDKPYLRVPVLFSIPHTTQRGDQEVKA